MKHIFKLTGLLIIICFVNSCRDKPELPSITTTSVTAISYTTAVSGGTLTNVGSSPLLKMGLCWSTSLEPTITDKSTAESLTMEDFISHMTQLTPNTTYYVRAYATNSDGTGYGNQVSFTTSQTSYPTLSTTEITGLTGTTAISGGNITADNGAIVTAKGVCWGTTQNPDVDGSKTINGEGTGTFGSSITGLLPSTLYYVRAYATNSTGTAYGNQIAFQTLYDFLFKKENSIIYGQSIISTFDDGYVVFGYIFKEDSRDFIPYIIKFGSSGNRIWEKEVNIIYRHDDYKYIDILETKNHNLVFCYGSNVIMFDKDGNILWNFEYITAEGYKCLSIVESDENNLYVLASDNLRTALLKISMDGQLIYNKLVKDGDRVNYNVGQFLCKSDNGNYFLSGFTNKDSTWRIWVAEINSMGEIIWENIYIDTYQLSRCTAMTKTNDGGIIITGSSMGNLNCTYARILKINSQHELIWEKSYLWDSFANRPYAIIQDSNSDFVFCGTQGYQYTRAVLVKLDKNGNEIWKRTYWPEGVIDYRWFLSDLLQTSNGEYLLVGTKSTLWGEAMPEGIWLKKVDQNGF